MAVSDRELDRRLARHLLDREPRRRRAGADESIGRQYFEFSLADHRPGLQPHLQRRGDRRTEDQARHRAGLHDPARLRHRRTSTRSSSSNRIRLHRGDVWQVGYGLNNRLLREADRLARSAERRRQPELLHRRAPRRSTTSSIRAAATRPPRASTPPSPLVARASPTEQLQGDFRTEWDPTFHTLRTLAANGAVNSGQSSGVGGLEPAALHSGTAGIRQRGLCRPLSERLGELAHQDQHARRHLLVQLRPAARQFPAAALPGVLQCAVLRLRRRVPDLQLRQLQYGVTVPQDRRFNISFTLAGNRHVLELPRRLRRAAVGDEPKPR